LREWDRPYREGERRVKVGEIEPSPITAAAGSHHAGCGMRETGSMGDAEKKSFADRWLEPLPLVLDGGLATRLEAYGLNLDDALWSGAALLERPDLVQEAHRDYLEAGAEVICTATYQVTEQSAAASRRWKGVDWRKVLDEAVFVAQQACSARESGAAGTGAWIAGSIGPYGATLHDGSEYRGGYRIDEAELERFHAEKVAYLAESGVDLLAFETLPSLREAKVLARLLRNHPRSMGYFSFTCGPGGTTAEGDELSAVARFFAEQQQAIAIGVNCVPSDVADEALRVLSASGVRALVVYPNSGEIWDAGSAAWVGNGGQKAVSAWSERAERWLEMGVRMMGGCCRTGPEEIAALARHIASIKR